MQWERDEVVLRDAEDRALRRRHADDAVREAVNVNLLADCRRRGKELARNVRADVCDARGGVVLGVREVATVGHVHVVDVADDCHRAVNGHVLNDVCAALDLRRHRACARAELVRQGEARAQELVVVEVNLLVAPLRGGDRVLVFEVFDAEATDGVRLRADAGDLLVNVVVEALDGRVDDDDRRHADDHPQKREGRAQLVRPDGRGGQLQCLDELHGSCVLRLSQGIGCTPRPPRSSVAPKYIKAVNREP